MTGQESLWSALEVRTQAAQCRDQLTVWDALDEAETRPCEACGAGMAEPCRPDCIGLAAALLAEPHGLALEQDAKYGHLHRAHCSCGWHSSGYSAESLARHWHAQHAAEVAR